jgi:hypothetical protein
MTMSTEQTGLEKAAPKTAGVITTAEQYRDALTKWQSVYNVLTPFTNVSGIQPSFGIIASVVKINTERGSGETYSGFTDTGAKAMPFLKGEKDKPSEELALAKIGLRKIAECGGISTSTTRTDPRTIAHYWEFKATASYRGLDGSLVTREATFEWDLRDGSDRLKGWTPNQITEGRKNGLRNCEARAINAAIRECGCGIRQKYTRAELEKPFLVVRVAFQPDFSDPEIKRLVTEKALGGTAMLYPPATRELPAVDADVIETEPRPVGSGSTAAPVTPKPDPNRPPVEGAVKIAAVDSKPWEKGGRKGTRYLITDSNGVLYSTLDKQHAGDAERFKASGDWVEIITERNGEFVNILEIVKAGTEPGLPGLDEV